MRTLNLGILAHVDAGKTTLTERLLYSAGVIEQVGSVDAGTTQTDTLDLERARGITIRAAVVSFPVGDVVVNLIDTPGHPDFIAEVERALGVLDGAVLVVSAVERVQPQTRILMRALRRLNVPTAMFVNKIDRPGAGYDAVLREISERLTPAIIPMGSTRELGTRAAVFTPWDTSNGRFLDTLVESLAVESDSILDAYVHDEGVPPYPRLREELAAQTKRAAIHPVFFGSALTGAGVDALEAGLVELLTPAEQDVEGPFCGLIFKIERTVAGERVAYAAIMSGVLRARHVTTFGRPDRRRRGKVTAIEVFDSGSAVRSESVSAGQIAKLHGLREVQVGDALGAPPNRLIQSQFAPPALESVVVPVDRDDGARLTLALSQLAEQDPLINVRRDPARQDVSVSLYGEVQKEVIQATLAAEYGIDATFRETTTIYIERPRRTGAHVEILQAVTHPFSATVGLRIDPAPRGSGVRFQLRVDPNLIPLYIYKTAEKFTDAMREYVDQTLQEGLFGWQVTDCVVTMTDCGYYIGDGPTKPVGRTPRTTAAHFRHLTPLVLARALADATTSVWEPIMQVTIELPTESAGHVLAEVATLAGAVESQTTRGPLMVLEGRVPAARAHELRRRLPSLTSGEGVIIETNLGGYQRVRGAPPIRKRTRPDRLNREEYLRGEVAGHPVPADES
jgi:ribosomal protection tetracycline resistance protein